MEEIIMCQNVEHIHNCNKEVQWKKIELWKLKMEDILVD